MNCKKATLKLHSSELLNGRLSHKKRSILCPHNHGLDIM